VINCKKLLYYDLPLSADALPRRSTALNYTWSVSLGGRTTNKGIATGPSTADTPCPIRAISIT